MADPTTVPVLPLGQTPPAPKPEDKKPEPPKPLNAEQLKGVQTFAARYLGKPVEAPKAETPEEKAAKEQGEKEKAEKAKPKPPAKKKPVKVEALSVDQIAEAAARGVASAMAPKPEDTKPAPKPEPEVKLTPAEQRKVAVLERMEKLYPEQYKGIAQNYQKSMTALEDYAAKWEKEHPGQAFDEEDEEHADFFKQNDVDWDDEHYTEAVADIKADQKVAAEREHTSKELSELKRQQKLRDSEPEIAKSTITPSRLYWEQMGDEFKDLVSENGIVDIAKFQDLQKKDPVAFGIRVQAAQALHHEIAELHKVMNGLVDYDEKNLAHVNIGTFAAQEEQRLAAKPQEDRLDAEGRDFLPYAKFAKLTKAEKANYWTFSAEDIAALRASHLSQTAKDLIAQEEKKLSDWAKARGLAPAEKREVTPEAKSAEPEPEPESNDGKPDSPSAAGESRMAAELKGGKDKSATPQKTFLNRFLGKTL